LGCATVARCVSSDRDDLCGRHCRTLVGATRVEDGVAWRRRRLMVLGIGLRLLDLNQVPVATTPAWLFRLAVGLSPWLAW
jgi:hypothetical protein